MKNIKRIFLLIVLAVLAGKILFSDIELSQNKALLTTASVASK